MLPVLRTKRNSPGLIQPLAKKSKHKKTVSLERNVVLANVSVFYSSDSCYFKCSNVFILPFIFEYFIFCYTYKIHGLM